MYNEHNYKVHYYETTIPHEHTEFVAPHRLAKLIQEHQKEKIQIDYIGVANPFTDDYTDLYNFYKHYIYKLNFFNFYDLVDFMDGFTYVIVWENQSPELATRQDLERYIDNWKTDKINTVYVYDPLDNEMFSSIYQKMG